jgi:dTDP-4-amino-4,6-dideoxygalactose transaminase
MKKEALNRNVQFISPSIKVTDQIRMIKSLRSGWLAPGKYTEVFENDLANFLNAKNSYFTSSATASLQIALLLGGIKHGDEVITSSITWASTATSIIWSGATPIFCDVDRETYLTGVEELKRVVTKKTKAIVLTHLYGQMCDIQSIVDFAEPLGIKVIEDSAHALESRRDGIRPGEISYAATFSFHAAKNLTCGQGGGLVINESPENVKLARRCGVLNNENDIREMVSFGGKFDSTDFQAALLVGQLKRIKKNSFRRKTIWEFYEKMCLENKLKFPARNKNDVHGYHQFVLEVPADRRKAFRNHLRNAGIATSVHFSPLHQDPYFRELKQGSFDLPNSENIGQRIVSLPTHVNLKNSDLDHIRITVESFFKIS